MILFIEIFIYLDLYLSTNKPCCWTPGRAASEFSSSEVILTCNNRRKKTTTCKINLDFVCSVTEGGQFTSVSAPVFVVTQMHIFAFSSLEG